MQLRDGRSSLDDRIDTVTSGGRNVDGAALRRGFIPPHRFLFCMRRNVRFRLNMIILGINSVLVDTKCDLVSY